MCKDVMKESLHKNQECKQYFLKKKKYWKNVLYIIVSSFMILALIMLIIAKPQFESETIETIVWIILIILEATGVFLLLLNILNIYRARKYNELINQSCDSFIYENEYEIYKGLKKEDISEYIKWRKELPDKLSSEKDPNLYYIISKELIYHKKLIKIWEVLLLQIMIAFVTSFVAFHEELPIQVRIAILIGVIIVIVFLFMLDFNKSYSKSEFLKCLLYSCPVENNDKLDK